MIAEARLARGFIESHPARAAMKLEQGTPEQASAVLRAVPTRAAAGVLREMNIPFAADCLVLLVQHDYAAAVVAIVSALAMDDAAAIIRAIPSDSRDGLLQALPEELREMLLRILPFAVGTAGSVMDPSVFRLPDDVRVVDARARLLRAARDLLYYVYVVDREQHLVGVLDIPELMIARGRDPVSTVMHRDVDRVSVFTPVSIVRDHPGWQSYHAMPVVDEQDCLLGAIRYQTLRRLEREASGRGAEPSKMTSSALAELFQLSTSGFVAGIAATAGGSAHELDRVVNANAAARDAESTSDDLRDTETASADLRDAGSATRTARNMTSVNDSSKASDVSPSATEPMTDRSPNEAPRAQ